MKFVLLFAAATLVSWADSTVSNAQTIGSYRYLILDGHTLKWGEPVLGTGAKVTFALVDEPSNFTNTRNCSSMVPLDSLLSRNTISAITFLKELDHALSEWEATANISFSSTDPANADILIGAQATPKGYAFANVEYDETATAPDGSRSLSRSLVCLNPTKPWKVGFDGNLEVYDLRYTLMHEIGHAIGLNHPLTTGQLMSHQYNEGYRVLQAGDIHGAETLYGSRYGQPGIRVGERGQNEVGARRKSMSVVIESQALTPGNRSSSDVAPRSPPSQATIP